MVKITQDISKSMSGYQPVQVGLQFVEKGMQWQELSSTNVENEASGEIARMIWHNVLEAKGIQGVFD